MPSSIRGMSVQFWGQNPSALSPRSMETLLVTGFEAVDILEALLMIVRQYRKAALLWRSSTNGRCVLRVILLQWIY